MLARGALLLLFALFFANSANADFDHQAHAVPGEEQTVYENPPGSGQAEVKLDASSSHSHYFDEGPPVVQGRIVSYEWKDVKTDKVLGTGVVLKRKFDVGTTTVKLTVKDQTGDVASATTKVTVVASSRYLPGCMVYYYEQHTEKQYASSYPRPYFTRWRKTIDIWDHNDIPKEVRSLAATRALRIITQFKPERSGQYAFMLRYMGGEVKVFVNGKRVGRGNADKEGQQKVMWFTENTTKDQHVYIEILLNRKYFPTRLVLFNNAKKTATLPATPQGVTTMAQVSFEPRLVVPILMYSTRSSSTTDGGQDIKLRVSGLDGAGDVTVFVRCTSGKKEERKMTISKIDASTHTIQGQTPAMPEACEAEIYLKTGRKGETNRLPYLVLSNEGASGARSAGGISFGAETLKDAKGNDVSVPAPTTIGLGPDGRYYLGTLTGVIQVLRLDSNTLRVKQSCHSARVAKKGSILGLAFNPQEDYTEESVRLYLSLSVLYFKSKNTGFWWNNGQIVAWKSVTDGACMKYDRTVITGLPVSDRDHGVNSITFDYSGKLYISVGSITNGGIRSKQFGDFPEAALSAAVLVADVNKRNFDGKVKYNGNEMDAKMTSGDVDLYATGIRNSFGMTYHSQHGLYATDNGMNQGFGETSTGCTTSIVTKQTQRDKLIRVVKGKYYGFPNRGRGECEFVAQKGALLSLNPATTGIAEYWSNAFNGQLRGQLLLTKFAVQTSGYTSRVTLSKDGNKLADGPTKVAEVSGVAVVVGPGGDVLMPQVQQGKVRVLRPKYKRDGVGVLGVVPRAGRKKGGNVISVYGYGWKKGEKVEVSVGGKECADVETVEAGVVKCRVGAGNGRVEVKVKVGGVESKAYGAEYVFV